MPANDKVVPARFQPELPLDRLILREAPDEEAIPMDVVFVGAGPAGLSGAIHLAQLVQQDGTLGEVNIAVLDKAPALGEHSLSGAVVDPRAFRELLPDLRDEDFPFRDRVDREAVYLLTAGNSIRIPPPPTMHYEGMYTASVAEMVRWLGGQAEELGINVLPGFPVQSLLVEDGKVIGVRTTPAGLERTGEPGSAYEAPTDLTGRVTVLSEGVRGALAQAYLKWQGIASPNPQIYALGVKEIWETRTALDTVVHTLGWPLPRDAFGGSWMYPLEPNLVSIGLVVGLDYKQTTLDTHRLMQQMKTHPFFRQYLEGGEMTEWGAKCIPEGGFYSLPERRSGDGLLLVGDAAGFVDVASLKGVHYAMQSGIFAARAIFDALKQEDTGAAQLAQYDRLVDGSYIREDLYRTRNARLVFKDGFYLGGAKAALFTFSAGKLFGNKVDMHADAAEPKQVVAQEAFVPDGKLTFSKVDAVFKSGNQTRDDIPQHLIVGEDIPAEVAEMYEHLCPAGVYERQGDRLVVNAPNCVDCKATDVLGPRWMPREGGSGPSYKKM